VPNLHAAPPPEPHAAAFQPLDACAMELLHAATSQPLDACAMEVLRRTAVASLVGSHHMRPPYPWWAPSRTPPPCTLSFWTFLSRSYSLPREPPAASAILGGGVVGATSAFMRRHRASPGFCCLRPPLLLPAETGFANLGLRRCYRQRPTFCYWQRTALQP
jgi:hypothetical protein